MSEQDRKGAESGPLGSLRGEDDRGARDQDGAPSASEGGGAQDPSPSHLSFIRRLQQRVGRNLDPGIQLQDKPEGHDSPSDIQHRGGSDASSDGDSSGSSAGRRLIEKLVDSVSLSARYRLTDEIARGGMGTILRVWDDDLRRNLAMKVMHGVARTDSSSRTPGPEEERLVRFLEEAQITGQLDHPGVVPVHDLGIDPEGRCYFTMRLVRGRELKEILRLARTGEEGWTMTRALGIILKVCEAMAFAHSKGVIHRDLKPSNIMVGRFGETYVMDWGLARVMGREDSHSSLPQDASSLSIVRTDRRDTEKVDPDSPLVTLEGDVVGTPSYMAPEQARGDLTNLGPRADVYSLGAILYELLTDRVPYLARDERVSAHAVLTRVLNTEPEPVAKLARDQPAELVAICEKAMARDQQQRYPSMLAVAEDIQAYLEDRVVKAYGGGALVEIKKWVQRNKGAASALGALVLVALTAAIGINLWTSRKLEELSLQEVQTAKARDEARDNLTRAKASEKEAQIALQQARESATAARVNAGLARRSSYSANLLAAVYSIRLGDMEGARARLEACDPEIRGWEWRYLELASDPTLRRQIKPQPGGSADRAIPLPGAQRVLVLTRAGVGRVMDYRTLEEVNDKEQRIRTGEVNVSGGFNIPATWEARSCASLRPGTQTVALFSSGTSIHVVDLETFDTRRVSIIPWLEAIGVQAKDTQQSTARVRGTERSFVRSLAWSPDGRFLLAGGFDGSLFQLDFQDPEPTPRLLADRHRDAVLALAWDRDAERFASVTMGGEFALWDAQRGRIISREREHEGPATDVIFDPRRGTFLTCGRDGAVLSWGRDDGRLVATVTRLGEPLQAIDVRGESGEIAVVSAPDDGGLDNGRCVIITPVEQINSIVNLLTSFLSAERNTTRELLGAEGGLQDVFFSADGTTVAAIGDHNALLVWDLEGPLSRLDLSHGVSILRRSTNSRGEAAPLDWNGDFIHNAQVGASDGEAGLLATAGFEGDILLWDRRTGFPTACLRGHRGVVGSLAFSPDGELLASGSQDATIRLWNTESGSLVRILRGHERWIQGLYFSPDGSKLYSTSGDKVLRVWDVDSGQTLSSVALSTRSGIRSAISKDGTLLATAAREVVIRDTATLEEVIRFPRRSGRVGSLCFASDNKSIWAGYSNGALRLWSLETGELLRELKDHRSNVQNTISTEDGSRLITTAQDRSIRVRDFETGQILLDLELDAHARNITMGPQDAFILAVMMEGDTLVLETLPEDRQELEARREARATERIQREVLRRRVLALLAERAYPSEVRAALTADHELGPREQRMALTILETGVDTAGYLGGLARKVVRNRRASESDLERALFHAQAASQLMPDDPRLQAVLGAAQMRSGLAAAALETLSRLLDKGREDRNEVVRLVGQEDLLGANLYLVRAMLKVGATDRLGEIRAEIDAILAGNAALRVKWVELRDEVQSALSAAGF